MTALITVLSTYVTHCNLKHKQMIARTLCHWHRISQDPKWKKSDQEGLTLRHSYTLYRFQQLFQLDPHRDSNLGPRHPYRIAPVPHACTLALCVCGALKVPQVGGIAGCAPAPLKSCTRHWLKADYCHIIVRQTSTACIKQVQYRRNISTICRSVAFCKKTKTKTYFCTLQQILTENIQWKRKHFQKGQENVSGKFNSQILLT